jgi:hypothetical protein
MIHKIEVENFMSLNDVSVELAPSTTRANTVVPETTGMLLPTLQNALVSTIYAVRVEAESNFFLGPWDAVCGHQMYSKRSRAMKLCLWRWDYAYA